MYRRGDVVAGARAHAGSTMWVLRLAWALLFALACSDQPLYALPPRQLRMTVALYAEPGPTWWRLAHSAHAHPQLDITAIISPAHGDNDAPMAGDDIPKYLAHNETWLRGMSTLREAGVSLQHYLHLRNLTCPRRGQCGPKGSPPSRSYCWLPDNTCVHKTRCCNTLGHIEPMTHCPYHYLDILPLYCADCDSTSENWVAPAQSQLLRSPQGDHAHVT
eukprot:COSAG02_NODE_10819_length_1852_cov_1.363377_2_plen_218_part_00